MCLGELLPSYSWFEYHADSSRGQPRSKHRSRSHWASARAPDGASRSFDVCSAGMRIFHSFPFLYSGAAVVHLFLRLVTDWAVQELIPRSPEARSITLSICGPRKTTQSTLSYSRNKFHQRT